MEEKKTEGLLLQAIPYLGHQKILKVLTKEKGLLSFMVKKKGLSQIADPFLTAEWVYRSKGKEIHPLTDLSPIHTFESLRTSYATLEIAGKIGKAVLQSQKPENSSPGIYLLTLAYLRKLPTFENPEILLSSFYLKVLLHDGLLGLDPHCECGNPATSLSPHGSSCSLHHRPGSLLFSPIEWQTLESLTFSRTFQALEIQSVTDEFLQKVAQLFSLAIQY